MTYFLSFCFVFYVFAEKPRKFARVIIRIPLSLLTRRAIKLKLRFVTLYVTFMHVDTDVCVGDESQRAGKIEQRSHCDRRFHQTAGKRLTHLCISC